MTKKKIDSLLTKLCIYTIEKATLPQEIIDRLSSKKSLTKKQLELITKRHADIQKKSATITQLIMGKEIHWEEEYATIVKQHPYTA